MKTFFFLTLIFTGSLFAEFDIVESFPPQTNAQIRDIQFYEEIGVAVGFRQINNTYQAMIAFTRDYGENWFIDYFDNFMLFGVEIYNKNEISLAGFHFSNNGIYLRSTDGGYNWNFNLFDGNVAPQTTSVYGIKYLEENTILLSGFDGSIFKSNNNGQNWELKNRETDSAIWNFTEDDNKIFSVAVKEELRPTIFSSLDNGDNWESVDMNLENDFFAKMLKIYEGDYFAIGSKNGHPAIYKSTNKGTSWDLIHLSEYAGRFDDIYLSNDKIFACGESGTIAYYDGSTWSERSYPNEFIFWEIEEWNSDIYITSAIGNIYKFQTPNSIISNSDPNFNLEKFDGEINLFDINGNKMNTSDVNILNSGVYLYQAISKNGKEIKTGKIIK